MFILFCTIIGLIFQVSDLESKLKNSQQRLREDSFEEEEYY